MFMRYLGGGIGHSPTQTQINCDKGAMDVDEGNSDIEEEAEPLEDEYLLESLHQIASTFIEGERDDDRDEVGEPADFDHGDETDETSDEGGGTDDGAFSGDGEPDDFGPEDGEDEGYVDIGYGTL
jgi:hypothetical protein